MPGPGVLRGHCPDPRRVEIDGPPATSRESAAEEMAIFQSEGSEPAAIGL